MQCFAAAYPLQEQCSWLSKAFFCRLKKNEHDESLMMKTRCLSIRPALQQFVVVPLVEATQGWLSSESVQICAVEISGADVAVACESRLASSPCMLWKTNSVSCWQLKIKSNWMYLYGHKNWSTKLEPWLAVRKPKQKTWAMKAQAESENLMISSVQVYNNNNNIIYIIS